MWPCSPSSWPFLPDRLVDKAGGKSSLLLRGRRKYPSQQGYSPDAGNSGPWHSFYLSSGNDWKWDRNRIHHHSICPICVQKGHVIGYLKYLIHHENMAEPRSIHSLPPKQEKTTKPVDLWVISKRSALPTFAVNTYILEILPKAYRAWLHLWLLIHWQCEG